jgi:hypothetical protein
MSTVSPVEQTLKPATKKSRPRPPAAPTAERATPVVDPRDAGRERVIIDSVELADHARLDYIDDNCTGGNVWRCAIAIVIKVDAGRVPASCMPLLVHVEDLAKHVDDILTRQPDVDWNQIPIEDALCAKLDAMNQIVAKITAPPEKFSMKEFVKDRLQERGHYGDVAVTVPQISKMTGLADDEIKKFRDDPESVDWTGRELPATLETEQAKRAAAAKFNSGRGLSTYAAKFAACGFGPEPNEN